MGSRESKVKQWVGSLVVLAVVVWFFSFAFRNPDMTRMRLLLTYWRHYLAGLVIIALGALLAGEVF